MKKTHEVQRLPVYSVLGTRSVTRYLIFFQLLEMGIDYPYATGGALGGPLLGVPFDDCVINFGCILLCKVPYSIFNLAIGNGGEPSKEKSCQISSLYEL